MKTMAKVLASLAAVLVVTAIWWQTSMDQTANPSKPIEQVDAQTPFAVISQTTPPNVELPVITLNEEEATDTLPTKSDVHSKEKLSDQGVGLTPMEQKEEEIAQLLYEGRYEQADALYDAFRVAFPEAAMTHRYPHLKARIKALNEEGNAP